MPLITDHVRWGAALIHNFYPDCYHKMTQCCRSLKKLKSVIFSRASQFQRRYIFDATWRLSARQQAPLTYPLDCAIRDVQCLDFSLHTIDIDISSLEEKFHPSTKQTALSLCFQHPVLHNPLPKIQWTTRMSLLVKMLHKFAINCAYILQRKLYVKASKKSLFQVLHM
jgi:hypothetical protein